MAERDGTIVIDTQIDTKGVDAGSEKTDWDLLGRTIGTGINTIVNTLDLFYTGIDWKNLGSKFAEGVNGVVYEVDWAKLGQFIGHKLLALPTVIVGFIENLDWSALSKAASTLVLNFLDTLIEFIHNIDWSKIVTNIQDALTNIQFSIFIVALVGLCYEIFKG